MDPYLLEAADDESDSMGRTTEDDVAGSDTEHIASRPDHDAEKMSLARQKGGWGLYKLFLDAVGKRRSSFWSLVTFRMSCGEISPGTFIDMLLTSFD